ncbi:MFS transporter [Candidatus Uhrbacteria bacterium]|nr:MFS transporter [Candidatus Uhrbacteria bacterium]
MQQVKKFYLASFLKNQTYFVPILIIFFQDLGLGYSQIFWIITGGAIFSFLIEIPTGILADLYGKRKSIILSKATITLAFIAFGFAGGFWTLLLANLLYELGKSFRSGTETAYIYDYLEEDKQAPGYTEVKAKQKFYARLSESIATALGGFLAVYLGFNTVFFIAAIPAAFNFLQTLTWVKIKEYTGKKDIKESYTFVKDTLLSIWQSKGLPGIILNVLIFTSVFVALATFIQPYMKQAGLPLEYFGVVYSGFLVIAAFLTRFSSNLEQKFGGPKVMNTLTALAVIPLFILGFGYVSIIGVGLFFLVLLIENLRSPITNTLFHKQVRSVNRATSGSVLSLFRTSGQIILLPVMGYVADAYSIYTAIFILACLILLTASILFIRPKTVKT